MTQEIEIDVYNVNTDIDVYDVNTKIDKVIDMEQLWDAACTDLVLDFTVFSQLLLQIGVKFVWNQSKQVCAWTDGSAIYINEAFIQYYAAHPQQIAQDGSKHNFNITKKELEFILCHELMHLLGLTYDRGKNMGLVQRGAVSDKDIVLHQLWNKATDYEINALLANNENVDMNNNTSRKPVGIMPDWCLYEEKYIDKSAEEIFKELLQDYEKNPQQYTFDKNKDGTNGKGQSRNGQGNNIAGLPGLDEHLPMLDDTTRNEIIQKIANVTSHSGQGVGSTAVSRLLEMTFKPIPFDWKKALTRYIRGWIKDNYTWTKPSRAGIAAGLILPSSSKTPCMHIGVAIDTSGSVGDDELQTMMNHLFSILGQFKQFTVDVWCNSTQVHENTWKRFTTANKSEIKDYKFESDGGTDLIQSFHFIDKKYKGDKLDLLLYMTDGEDYNIDGNDEITTNFPVIWLILDNNDFKKPSHIKGAVYPFIVNRDKNGW